MPTDRFFTADDLVGLFHIPKATLYRWTSTAKGTGRVLPHVKIGKRLLFEREAVEAFIDAHRVEGRRR